MDDTQRSRISDAAAAATRKRRSSILKSQRAPRAPLSELEFNVATPTDTAKSRRVSFSRRTGVVEFVTNEATNTWKNFYEEHNKTLESSGNDSEVKNPSTSVGHIGKRIFDQQFQEVEAVDFVSTLDDGRGNNIEISMNNINFADQLESLECTTDDRKLTAPQQKFELSTFTDHQSKLFGDDLAISGMGELSDRINVNFSVMQPMGADNDDLDEIQRDLQLAQSNGMCQGIVEPRVGRNLSEFMEVDLNTTHVAFRNDESDMSITDTIQSPKVQEVPKTNISFKLDNKTLDENWVADKENIIVNPYVAPKETANFAINEEPEEVLVFDGKRLTIQSETPASNKVDFRKTLLPNNPPDQTPLRKSIFLNMNDDLPNFVDDPFASMSQITRGKSMCDQNSSNADMLMTQPLSNRLETTTENGYENNAKNLSVTQAVNQLPNKTSSGRRNTVLYEYDSGDISVTQAVPSNIILADKSDEQRRTNIVFEDDASNISVTQAISSNILLPNKENGNKSHKRRTIVFESDSGNISVTQAVPSNIIFPENGKALNLDCSNDISVTGVESKESNVMRKTIVFEPDAGDISITQAVPTNILADNAELLSERRNTQNHEDNAGNIFITQAVSETATSDKRKTIVFESDSGNISVTQAVPRNLIIPEKDQSIHLRKETSFYDDVDLDAVPIKLNSTENYEKPFDKKNTQVYEHDAGDLSMTQAVPANILPGLIVADKRKTIVHESDSCDISITQAVPSNIILRDEISVLSETRKTSVNESYSGDIYVTQGVPANILMLGNIENAPVEREPLVYDCCNDISIRTSSGKFVKQRVQESKNEYISLSQEADAKAIDKENANKSILIEKERLGISITEDIPLISQNKERKRRTIVFDDDAGNMSITRPISVEFITVKNVINDDTCKINTEETIKTEIHGPANMQQDIFVYQHTTDNNSMLQSKRTEHGDSKRGEPINAPMDGTASSSNIAKDNINQSYTSQFEQEDNKPLELDTKAVVPSISSSTSQFEQEDNKPLELDTKAVVPSISSDNISTNEPALVKSESDESKAKMKKAILCDLLDMSNASMEYGFEDKNVMAVIESDITSKASIVKDVRDNSSDSSMFYITKDNADEAQTDKSENSKSTIESLKLENLSQHPLEHKDDNIKDDVQENTVLKINRHYEAVVSPDAEKDNYEANSTVMSFGNNDNTKELLNMLSNFTDKEEEDNPLGSIKADDDEISAESQMEKLTNVKLNFSPKMQSRTESTENSLSNTPISHSRLQKSVENIDIINYESPETKSLESKKCVRLSPDVIKTLQFEDESTSYASFSVDSKTSSLKKTVFGETSYMTDNHAAVPIPSYLKDVSDGIKQLMTDLVKPMADVLPFNSGKVDKPVKKMASTCSMNIQANLITSSQIDLDTDIHPNQNSVFLNNLSSEITDAANRNLSHTLKSSLKPVRESESIKVLEMETQDDSEYRYAPRAAVEVSIPGRVLMFDLINPLNNILLSPADTADAHRYDPIDARDSLISASKRRDSDRDDRITCQYYVESLLATRPQAGDACLGKISEVQSDASNMNKPISVNQLVHTSSTDVRDSEVNTWIVMKRNKELLEGSSSLTFVDDAVVNDNFDVDIESMPSQEIKRKNSTVEVIYKMENENEAKSSNITSNDEEIHETIQNTSRSKKRAHSPMKRDKHNENSLSNVDLTTKPTSKRQRHSNSPDLIKAAGVRCESLERTTKKTPTTLNSKRIESDEESEENAENTNKAKSKKPHGSRKRSPGRSRLSAKKKQATTITVQQLITEYHIEAKVDQEQLNSRIMEALKSGKPTSINPETISCDAQYSPNLSSSLTSSRNKNEMGGLSVTTSESQASYSRSKVLPMDWQPELINELSSKNLAVECESGVNVVAKIDMLPFMGSRECEWEASSSDTWSFRLLHGRLRLSVRLAHRHDNATRSCVRADTPVLAVTLETTQQDKKNPVAVLCVNFAAEAMRYFILKGCSRAGDIPALLRRAAGVARVALRWGRAMRDTWAHLAYTITEEGFLSLKVANIPLRSVWEVTMTLELVLDEEREVPWPRARDVRVHGVVSDVRVADEEVRRVLAGVKRDWGHAPRTVWKIFKYLKNKTRDDDLLLGV